MLAPSPRNIADCSNSEALIDSEALIGATLTLVSGKFREVDSGIYSETGSPPSLLGDGRERTFRNAWLMPMKIWAILDEAQWNSPSDPSYGFIQEAQVLDYHKSNKA